MYERRLENIQSLFFWHTLDQEDSDWVYTPFIFINLIWSIYQGGKTLYAVACLYTFKWLVRGTQDTHVAKNYDYAFIDSFWGSAGFLNSYAALVGIWANECQIQYQLFIYVYESFMPLHFPTEYLSSHYQWLLNPEQCKLQFAMMNCKLQICDDTV